MFRRSRAIRADRWWCCVGNAVAQQRRHLTTNFGNGTRANAIKKSGPSSDEPRVHLGATLSCAVRLYAGLRSYVRPQLCAMTSVRLCGRMTFCVRLYVGRSISFYPLISCVRPLISCVRPCVRRLTSCVRLCERRLISYVRPCVRKTCVRRCDDRWKLFSGRLFGVRHGVMSLNLRPSYRRSASCRNPFIPPFVPGDELETVDSAI